MIISGVPLLPRMVAHGSHRGIDCHVFVTDSSVAWIVLFRNTSMKFLLFCSAVLETPKVMSILSLLNYRK